MKLIDLLVRDLPVRGGWRDGCLHASQDRYGDIYSYYESYFLRVLTCELADDWKTAIITREQYEAALDADSNPVWDGEGVPTVRCVCEIEVPGGWRKCRINYVSSKIIVYQMIESGQEYSSMVAYFRCRPIRTNEQRKRDFSIGAMERAWEQATKKPACNFYAIYDAIAEGKIPGVRLDDESGI